MRRMVRRSVAGAFVGGVLLVALTGCSTSSEPTSGSSPSPPVTTSPAGPTSDWLAVIASSADPNDLDGPRSDIVTALGTNDPRVVVSPGACFSGIGRRYAARYVLAMADTSREVVGELLRRAGTDAEWVGPVTSTCVD
jgi:hypothetical protein